MAVVDVKSVSDWSDSETNRSDMFSSWCVVSAPLLNQSTRLSKFEADSTFIISWAFQLKKFVSSILDCLDSGVVLLN